MRCINKDTKKYVDVEIPYGNGPSVRKLMLKNADFLSGSWNPLSSSEKRDFHYCFLFTYYVDNDSIEYHISNRIHKDGDSYTESSDYPWAEGLYGGISPDIMVNVEDNSFRYKSRKERFRLWKYKFLKKVGL
jgi:hypothetical protein